MTKKGARLAKTGKVTTSKSQQPIGEFARIWATPDEVFARALAVYRYPTLAVRDVVRQLRNKRLKAANRCWPLRDKSGVPLVPEPPMDPISEWYWNIGGFYKFAACLKGRTKLRGFGGLNPERTKMEFFVEEECGVYIERPGLDEVYPQGKPTLWSYDDLPPRWQVTLAILHRIYFEARAGTDILQAVGDGGYKQLVRECVAQWSIECQRWGEVLAPPDRNIVRKALEHFHRD